MGNAIRNGNWYESVINEKISRNAAKTFPETL